MNGSSLGGGNIAAVLNTRDGAVDLICRDVGDLNPVLGSVLTRDRTEGLPVSFIWRLTRALVSKK
jgi:hypothetical protein